MIARGIAITGVVATSKVVGCILLAANQLFWVEELAVSPSPHLINDCGLKVDKNSTGDVLPSTSFAEKGVESIVSPTNCLITRHLAIRLQEQKAYHGK